MAEPVINIDTFISKALKKIQDNSAEMRERFFMWFNEACRNLEDDYQMWSFLKVLATGITVGSSGEIEKPPLFLEFGYVSDDKTFFLEEHDRLTGLESYHIGSDVAASSTPVGFFEDDTNIYLRPAVSGSMVNLQYIRFIPEYSDGDGDTIIPQRFAEFIRRQILVNYYEYDADERVYASITLRDKALDRLIERENRVRPVPKRAVNPTYYHDRRR